MNPTSFETPESVGTAVYKKLRQQIRHQRVLVIGSAPVIHSYARIWDGFLRAVKADRVNIEVAYQLRDLLTPADLLSLHPSELKSDDGGRVPFVKEIRSHYERGKLVLIHTLTTDASHLMRDSVSRALSALPHNPVIAISLLPFAIHKDEIGDLQPPCNVRFSESKNIERLGCAAKRISKKFIRQQWPDDKYVAAMERHGLKEYLVFVHEPATEWRHE